MIYAVYHMTNEARADHPMSFVSCKGIRPIWNKTHCLVGTVEANDLNEAFMLTNHIDSDWTKGPKVDMIADGARSSSVGDIFVEFTDDEDALMVAGCGFKKVNFKIR